MLIVTGCSSAHEDQSASSDSRDCTQTETICIGLVLEGGFVDDGAFNAAAWAGVQQAAEITGGVAEYLESAGPQAYSENLDAFAKRGFDVIVTTDVGRPELTIEAASANPQTQFIGISQPISGTAANATGVIFDDGQAGYAAGYLAGLMTKTGVVGAVLGSQDVLPLRRFAEGYRLGAQAARPDVAVLLDYNNTSGDSFNDPQWGASTARDQVSRDADVIFGAGGTTGTGALIAVAELPEAGTSLLCIGIDVDQYETVPEARPCLLSSAEKKISAAVIEAITKVLGGTQSPENIVGDIGLAPFHDFEEQVPDEVKSRINDVLAGLASGSISTF
jgi:basic membrane protein A